MLGGYVIRCLPFIPLVSKLVANKNVGYFFACWVEIYNGNSQQSSIRKHIRSSVRSSARQYVRSHERVFVS